MTGVSQYRPEEIEFVLHALVNKVKVSKIQDDFEARFHKKLRPNQVRYIKNKYGRHSRFDSVMVNFKGPHAADLRKRSPPSGQESAHNQSVTSNQQHMVQSGGNQSDHNTDPSTQAMTQGLNMLNTSPDMMTGPPLGNTYASTPVRPFQPINMQNGLIPNLTASGAAIMPMENQSVNSSDLVALPGQHYPSYQGTVGTLTTSDHNIQSYGPDAFVKGAQESQILHKQIQTLAAYDEHPTAQECHDWLQDSIPLIGDAHAPFDGPLPGTDLTLQWPHEDPSTLRDPFVDDSYVFPVPEPCTSTVSPEPFQGEYLSSCLSLPSPEDQLYSLSAVPQDGENALDSADGPLGGYISGPLDDTRTPVMKQRVTYPSPEPQPASRPHGSLFDRNREMQEAIALDLAASSTSTSSTAKRSEGLAPAGNETPGPEAVKPQPSTPSYLPWDDFALTPESTHGSALSTQQ